MNRPPLSSILVLAVLLFAAVGVASGARLNGNPVPLDTMRSDTAQRIDPVRFGIVSGITVGGFVLGHGVLNNLWWKGERSSFHFEWERDWRYSLGADKLGHAWFPYLTSTFYNGVFLWCGLDTAASLWASSGLALAYQTYIEIRDGFSAEWGFSWGDMVADVLGAALPVARHYVPALRAFEFKISFAPSERFRSGSNAAIFDDYESTLHWISVDVNALLPRTAADLWPDWLNVAVGHTVVGLDEMGAGHHEFYLSLDWNLERLPGDTDLLRFLKRLANLYHLPAPAVRLSPGVVWYGLKL